MSKQPMRLGMQFFGAQTYNPDNVLLMDAKTGKIPSETSDIIVRDFVTQSAVAQMGKAETMTKPVKEFTYLANGPGAYWVDETERIQTDKPEWITAKMEAKKLGVIIPVSKEFLRYTVSNFFEEMRAPIAEAFYTKFDQAALFGKDTPFGAGKSVIEKAIAANNSVVHADKLYEELNQVIGLVEDGDHEPNGLLTTRRFNKELRGAVDTRNLPIFNDARDGATAQALGLPVGYASSKSWDYEKAALIGGDWDMLRFGVLQDIEFAISEDATLTTLKDGSGNAVNLFERDMFALRATMHVAFITLKDDAFAVLAPKALVEG